MQELVQQQFKSAQLCLRDALRQQLLASRKCGEMREKSNKLSLLSPSDRCGNGKNPFPQCAFEMSMFNVSAIHITSRSWLRSSSTHEPSDPPLRMSFSPVSWRRNLKRFKGGRAATRAQSRRQCERPHHCTTSSVWRCEATHHPKGLNR